MRDTVASRTRTRRVFRTLTAAVLWFLVAGFSAAAAEDRKALLVLPIASGTPGQELAARALGGLLEDGFGTLRTVRLVAGSSRELALRELSSDAVLKPEAFGAICRRAGADLAVLGGSTLVAGRLALEIRIFDVAAGRELRIFQGEEPPARAFALVEAAVRHVAAEAALGSVDTLFPRGVTVSLEAYAAYRAAVLELTPAARIEQLRGVLKIDPDYADPARRLGVELFRDGKLEESLVVLERAVALGPTVAEARNNFGVALAAAGRQEQAQREFEEAVSLAPDYAEARLNLARVFEDRGRTADAEKQYTALLDADAGNDKARAGRAALYDGTGRSDLALKEFRLLSARRPDLAEGEFMRAGQEARKAREYARAGKYFLRATDINPQSAPAWAELGTNSYLAGDYPKGVEFFRKALTIDPGQAAYHYYLGLALDKGRQQEEALREYRRAVELGGPPEARFGLARAALESGDPGQAVEELNRLLVASPDHAEAKVLLAQATSEMESRRRLVESQSQFANQRLARLEQIVADANRANRELEARLQAVVREKQALEKQSGAPQAATPALAATRPAPLERDVERLQGELNAERAARRSESAEAVAALALLRADNERLLSAGAAEQQRAKSEFERLQADLAAAQAKSLELGRGSGEIEELRQRLAGIKADQARVQTESNQEREQFQREATRLKTEFVAEREARRVDAERYRADLAAGESVRGELAKKVSEAAELKGQLLAAQGAISKAEDAQRSERERGERTLLGERQERRAEVDKLRAELAVGLPRRQEKERLLKDLAAEKSRAAAAQLAREKAEKAQAAERESRGADIEKLKTALAAALVRKQDFERLTRDLDQEQTRARTEFAGRQKAEQALAGERQKAEQVLAGERRKAEQTLADERGQAAKTLAAERTSRLSEMERLKAELATALGRGQDRERLAQELAAERTRTLAEQSARVQAEQALATLRSASELARAAQHSAGEQAIIAERERGDRAVAAEREESRRQGAQFTARVAVLESQVKTQGEALTARDADLAAARAREISLVAQHTRGQADLALLAERQSALEARAAAESRTLAEREQVFVKVRLAVRDLALELGRSALRTQSWEQARGYLEQAAEADPRSAEAWYGLGEALFQLGLYDKSKQMYDKAKQIY